MAGKFRRICRRLGFDVGRYPGFAEHWPRLVAMLERHGITLVLDVGANAGQYATALIHNGYRGRIVSYEPTQAAHAAAVRAAAAHPDWRVAERAAVGERPGEVEVNVSPESDMSSLLPMTAEAQRWLSSARYAGKERVPMVTLAAELPRVAQAGDRVFVKSDTQGYEAQVLDGLGDGIERIEGVQLELSMAPVYESQPHYLELLERLEALGFTAHMIVPGYYNRNYGRMLEFDVVCFREPR
ncbi:MAG: FkbM family methyltransferase [Alphaproteobacteria bacterium]